MLPPEVAEGRLLASLMTVEDLSSVLRAGISEESFQVYGEAFRFYRDYVRDYGGIPDLSDVRYSLNGGSPEGHEGGDLGYYIKAVHDNHLVASVHASVVGRFGEGGMKLQENPSAVIGGLLEDLRQLSPRRSDNVYWVDRDAMERMDWLRERERSISEGNVVGIPTGLDCFDRYYQGWEPGEAVMLIAPKGVGKSWLVLYFAAVAHANGYKCLVLSPEMSVRQCALRLDVLLAYQYAERYVGQDWIPDVMAHSGLSQGAVEHARYEAWLRELSRKERLVVVDSDESGGFTTESMLSYIEEYQPDLVVLDGIHLLGGDPRQAGWERIKEAADALKATAQKNNCTVIWTGQVDRSSMANSTEPAANGSSAAYGKAAVEAANRLITMARHDSENYRTFKVPNNRSGYEHHSRLVLEFDVDVGRIRQVPENEVAG